MKKPSYEEYSKWSEEEWYAFLSACATDTGETELRRLSKDKADDNARALAHLEARNFAPDGTLLHHAELGVNFIKGGMIGAQLIINVLTDWKTGRIVGSSASTVAPTEEIREKLVEALDWVCANRDKVASGEWHG